MSSPSSINPNERGFIVLPVFIRFEQFSYRCTGLLFHKVDYTMHDAGHMDSVRECTVWSTMLYTYPSIHRVEMLPGV
jgi:hypothetical protein